MFIRQDPQKELSDKDWHIDKYYLSWQDDTFKWFGDSVGDLWFETTLNISLRVPPISANENYLKALKEYPEDKNIHVYNFHEAVEWVRTQTAASNGFHRYVDLNLGPANSLEWFYIRKITEPDSSRSSGLKYTGYSIPQVYMVNPDHYVTKGIKKFYTIPLEYDCCSECREKFPHRIYYSRQSFQEEKSDNYRSFLPNNYRDIEGETGEITNVFRFYNNLFAHTEEALWKMGRNYQERVTGDIVSFIGTGSYFEIPPQKIIDDDTGSSAGTQHKWSSIKTPVGYFFISENQGKIYQFDGEKINPISNIGLSNWFKNNMKILSDGNPDNPSNPEGTGYISTYDSRKERIIFTKLDKEENINNSWTISFSLKNNTWVSWHSYIPNFYINIPEKFYSWKSGNDGLWKHNVVGKFQTFYGNLKPHIVEYVSIPNSLVTKVWNTLQLQTESKTYNFDLKEYVDERYITFNKAILYNTRQCSGEMNLIVRDSDLGGEDYIIVTGKQIGRASCRERVSSPV